MACLSPCSDTQIPITPLNIRKIKVKGEIQGLSGKIIIGNNCENTNIACPHTSDTLRISGQIDLLTPADTESPLASIYSVYCLPDTGRALPTFHS